MLHRNLTRAPLLFARSRWHNANNSHPKILMSTTSTATASTLNRLGPGECATILALDAGEELHQRLVALGLGIGNSVRLLRRARFGGPLHVRVGSTELMLRVREACCIRITDDHSADATAPSR
jgi:ferrous iron transport protein A